MRKGAVIAIIIIAVVVIGGIIGFVVWNNSNHNTGGSIDISGQSGQGLKFEDNQGDTESSIPGVAMPGWEKIQIPANTRDVSVNLYNPEENEGKYHLTFELQLADTGETLYTSGLLKAGDHIRNITLNRPLAAGTYNAIMHIQPYTADDKLIAKNNANVALKLIVVEA